MEKIFGATAQQNGLVHVGRKNWTLFFGYGEKDGNGYNYRHVFDHKPTEDEVKQVVKDAINAETEERILSGMTYDGAMVWLSSENQRNYTMLKMNGAVPVTVKLGTDGEPVYRTLETQEALEDFCGKCASHVQSALEDGWKEWQSVDWSEYGIEEEGGQEV